MLNTKNFVVYKSSAGAGKTFTLVREYIALALASPGYFRHILAVTFTNKAANEMKQRVVVGLFQLANPGLFPDAAANTHMLKDLVLKTGFDKDEIHLRAKEVLSSLLHNYDDFAVRTIDSFVTRIIRTFSNDLHLPVDFEIEMDQSVLLDEAVDNLIGKAGLDPEITRILVEFTESKAEEEKSWHIEGDFKNVGNYLFSEEGFQYAPRLQEITPDRILAIINKVKKFKASIEETIIAKSKPAIDLIRENQLSAEDFYFGNQGIGKYFLKLSAGELALPNARVLTTISDDKWCATKADIAIQGTIDSIKVRLRAIYDDCTTYIESNRQDFQLLGMISGQLYQLGVLSAIEKELGLVKKERRVLHISEFNRMITEIIQKEPVPFIYERTGEKFRNYLIDEFQDTSDLQWRNLLPLIANSLASGNYNLVVGDGKQAIYRFRNGQVEQFMLLPALPPTYDPLIFGDASKALVAAFEEKWLDSNYRSLPEIIHFNNHFFRFIGDKLDPSLKKIYEGLEQKTLQGKSGGFIRIELLENNSKQEFIDLNLGRIHFIVLDLLEQGYQLKDMVILTRSNIQGNIVARFLMDHQIEVVSAEALLLASSPKVNFLISALAFIKDPEDVISMASALIQLDLWGKLPGGRGLLTNKINAVTFLESIKTAGMELDILKIRNLPLYDACEEIIRIFGLDKGGYDSYVQFFLEFVAGQAARDVYQISDLLEAWEEKKSSLSVVVPEGIDAIRIMTIHKSKGLEFPVVIWPFATEKLRSTLDQLWIEPEHPSLDGLPVALVPTSEKLEDAGYGEIYTKERNKSVLDMINLVYVAFTRAVEQLYVLSADAKDAKPDTFSLPAFLSEYLKTFENEWQADGRQFSRGIKQLSGGKHGGEPAAVTSMDKFASAGWHQRIRIARRAPENWSALATPENQNWGNLVHDCLSRVDQPENLDVVLFEMKKEFLLSDESFEKLRRDVSAVMSHPLLKPYFSGAMQVKPEASILMPEGNLIRPDRVILDGNTAIILEFKTGQSKDWHAKQLMSYGDALLRMGIEKVKRYLVYIGEELKVEEI